MINTLLPLEQEYNTQKSRDPDEQYKQDAYLNQKLITKEILEASSSRTSFRQGTSRRESTGGRHLLQTLPSLSISLFLFTTLDPNLED